MTSINIIGRSFTSTATGGINVSFAQSSTAKQVQQGSVASQKFTKFHNMFPSKNIPERWQINKDYGLNAPLISWMRESKTFAVIRRVFLRYMIAFTFAQSAAIAGGDKKQETEQVGTVQVNGGNGWNLQVGTDFTVLKLLTPKKGYERYAVPGVSLGLTKQNENSSVTFGFGFRSALPYPNNKYYEQTMSTIPSQYNANISYAYANNSTSMGIKFNYIRNDNHQNPEGEESYNYTDIGKISAFLNGSFVVLNGRLYVLRERGPENPQTTTYKDVAVEAGIPIYLSDEAKVTFRGAYVGRTRLENFIYSVSTNRLYFTSNLIAYGMSISYSYDGWYVDAGALANLQENGEKGTPYFNSYIYLSKGDYSLSGNILISEGNPFTTSAGETLNAQYTEGKITLTYVIR